MSVFAAGSILTGAQAAAANTTVSLGILEGVGPVLLAGAVVAAIIDSATIASINYMIAVRSVDRNLADTEMWYAAAARMDAQGRREEANALRDYVVDKRVEIGSEKVGALAAISEQVVGVLEPWGSASR